MGCFDQYVFSLGYFAKLWIRVLWKFKYPPLPPFFQTKQAKMQGRKGKERTAAGRSMLRSGMQRRRMNISARRRMPKQEPFVEEIKEEKKERNVMFAQDSIEKELLLCKL